MHHETCHRCHSPKIPGHGMVCFLTSVSEITFWLGLMLVGAFWYSLVSALFASMDGSSTFFAMIFALNAILLMLLSLVIGTRARWMRHELVADLEEYLDEDGSCCGGACAGSCGGGGCGPQGGCGTGGCGPEGGCGDGACDTPEADPMEEEGGCCGGGCCGPEPKQ